jgi:LysR family transcriptional regulator, glycine cleavage system transcriptional activator
MRMAVPLVRLAPLDFIRGFIAVGRRMSITLAAQNLCLTQSAVSRQVHALGEVLGVTLLVRGYRSISFTPEGGRLFRTADSAVQQLQEVFEVLNHPEERQPVTITASVGVAALWLLPRLGSLQRRHPEIDVRVAATDKVLDVRAEGIDLGIRYSSVSGAPPASIRLFDESIVPDAHPCLGLTKLNADTLARHVLLEFDGSRRPPKRLSADLQSPIQAYLRCNAIPTITSAMPASSGNVGICASTRKPMRVAVAGRIESLESAQRNWRARSVCRVQRCVNG